jgi:membrane-associated phospholipid phosphatase
MNFLELDQYLFQLINMQWIHPALDIFFLAMRNKMFWLPLYLFLLTFFVVNFGKRGWIIVIGLVFTIGLADSVSTRCIKRTVQRSRPCQELALSGNVRPLVQCNGYSFTSNHASNHMAIAIFLFMVVGKRFRKLRLPLICWALTIGYAQIYVGVHYPTDILGGFLLGYVIGLLGFEWTSWTLRKYFDTDFAV